MRTHCPYCALQCGMRMTASAEITPDEAFPVNRGQLCVKGFTAAALIDHPDRLQGPLVRSSDGSLRAASWDVALDEAAGRLRDVRDKYGADANGVFGSGALTNEKAYLLGKFARVGLRTANIDYNGRYCMSSAAAGQNRAFGVDRGLPFPLSDIGRADAVLLWGANCADTMPPLMQWFDEMQARGGSLIVADPRRSATAQRAELHLQLVPGSDLALANGLLHMAILDNLIDCDYIRTRTTGFDEVRRRVLAYLPDRVERLTGVAERDLRRAVHLLAEAPASMLLSGRGPEQQSKGVDGVLAFTNLMLALGKVGRAASGYGCLTGQGNGQGGREHGQKADQLPGYRMITDPADRAAVAAVWGVDAADLPGAGLSAFELLDALGSSVHGLLVMGSNVAVASPDTRRIASRLADLDTLVVVDTLLNETSAHAHVVLPTTVWAEEDGTMTNLEGRVIRRRRTRPAPSGVRSDLQILAELAARLGESERFDYARAEDVFDELRLATAGSRADYSGISYDRIDACDGIFWPCPATDHPGTPRLFAERFAHPDGRARFVPVEHRAAGEEPDEEYPLYFTTGRYREHYNSGTQTRAVAALLEARPEPKLQLHPLLASGLGLVVGGQVRVRSRRGEVVFAVDVSADVRPDTLFAPFHWGGRASANVLTNPVLDPTSRMPEFKICAVRAEAVR